MSQPDNVLQKIQERLTEKDEVINVQMEQIVQLEDELATLRAENEELKSAKQEYDRIRKQLDTLLNG